MMKREEIFAYVKEKYNTEPDYPWDKNPSYAVLRHDNDGKWYGLVMNVPKSKLDMDEEGNAEIINVKCDPVLNSLLRGEEGIMPAYHMNKKHWISIDLDSSFPKEEIIKLIDASYDLTR